MIAIKNLTFTYSNTGIRALKNIDFALKKGEIALLTGPSRAGKSTLCLSLAGLIPEYFKGELSGEIYIEGKRIKDRRIDIAEMVGIVFQDYESQLFSTRVDLEVAFGLENRGIDRESMKKRIPEVLELVGLNGLEKRNPATLSGGQRQRLAIASVFAMEPEILILDEPFTDLDPEGKKEILNLLERLKSREKTILMVEHDTEIADKIQNITVLYDGKILYSGKPAFVLKDSENLRTHGVSPHPLVMLFEKLGLNENPLDLDSAERALKRRGIKLKNYTPQDEEGFNSGSVVTIEKLTFQYSNGITALKDINLEIKRGDFVAIVGKNGSGKTTLAKHINRLLEPASGRILLAGEDIKKLNRSEIGKRVGYVFQNPDHQIFSETVYDEVAFAPRNFGFKESEIKERTEMAIKTVGLEGYENKDPFILTRGEREKVAVASVLSATPDIIILDEPTTGLDYQEVKNTMSILKELNSKGSTIIIITHNMNVVVEFAKKVIAMKEGEVIFYGKTRDFFSSKNLLKETGMRAPLITELGKRFGFTALSVDEFLRFIDV